jgi:CheY-like chemotaxis protein
MNGPVIFFIDDEENLRDLVAELLRDEGYEVYTFAEGQKAFLEAKSRIEKNLEIDLVLTDVNMPLMSGIKLAEELRKLAFRNAIVLFSGESGEELEKLKRIPGITGVEEKPYSTDIFLDHISQYIKQNIK